MGADESLPLGGRIPSGFEGRVHMRAEEREETAAFLVGGGEVGALMRAHDWSASPLGPPDAWPQPLKTLVGVMLGASQPMFVAWGVERTLLYNSPYAEILAAKHPAALGRDFLDVWHEIRGDLVPIVDKAYAGEPVHMADIELVMHRRGFPEETHFSFFYAPVRDETGEVAGLYCACTEITGQVLGERRRREAEAALRAERDRSRRVLEGMGEGFGLLDRDFRVVDINAEGLRLDGRPREAIVGKTHWEAFPGSETSELGRAYKRAMEERVPVSLEHSYTWADGHEAWLEMRAYPTEDGLALFWRDVTARKRAEEALRRAGERAAREAAEREAILGRLAEGVIVADAQGRITFVNDAAERLHGVKLLGVTPDAYSESYSLYTEAGEPYPALELPLARAVAGETVEDVRWRIRRPDGSEVLAIGSARPVLDAGGERIGAVLTVRDDTQRRAAEAALRASEARLAFLDRLGAETASLSDADAVLATTTRLLGEHLGLSVCAYADMDEDEDGFTIRGDWAAPGARSIVGRYRLVDFGARAVANLTAGLPLVVHDNARELPPEDAATYRSIGIAATVCMPLVKEGRLTALMAIHDRVPRTWTEAEIGLLREVTARSWAHVERVAATAQLRESEARFRLMADAVPQIVWITDAAGRAEFFNRQWTVYTGLPFEPTTAADVAARHVHPDDGQRTMEAFDAARATGGVFAVEHRIRSASGDYRWFLVRAEPYRDPQTGEIVRWFGASTDIHDRKLAEERLRELADTLEARVVERTAERDRMWDTSPDLMAVIDFDGVIRRVNPAWTTLLGYAPDALVGRHVNDFVLPDHHADTVAAYERTADGGRVAVENRYVHEDGSTRWISWVAAPAGDMIYATGRDVTAEKTRRAELQAAEDARRRADALYRAYFENTAEALFVIGVLPDGGFVVEDLNPAHQASVGLPLADVAGKRIDEILPTDAAQTVQATYRHVLATGKVHQYRETFRLQGTATHWDTVLVPVRDAEGRIVRIIGSSRDLTPQLAAEEQLRHSQKMEAMGQLTGGVAHDFNNLLTPIIGPLDMLVRRGLGNERERRMLGAALQSAERAKVLVQRLLAFARRQPLQPADIDMGGLVEGMADLIVSTLGATIDVRVTVDENLPLARADANQVEMALLNLAVNARDAMPEGGMLTISVTRARAEHGGARGLAAGDYVRLSVTDTGIGMDETTVARAIEPFFSTKGVGKGTGLGLSMVHGLAAQLGGGLTLESEPGRGTSVHLWLPIGVAVPALGDGASEVAAAPVETHGVVLVVDDEDLVRMSVADMLGDFGFHVVQATSGEEALSLIRTGRRPDLLVTDHLMPGMNGVELARRARLAQPGLPVLIVSGYADVEAIAPDLPRLAKPFRPAELAERIAELMPVGGTATRASGTPAAPGRLHS